PSGLESVSAAVAAASSKTSRAWSDHSATAAARVTPPQPLESLIGLSNVPGAVPEANSRNDEMQLLDGDRAANSSRWSISHPAGSGCDAANGPAARDHT